MKLWLTGWNVLHGLGSLDGLALCLLRFLQAAYAGHGWISSMMRRSNDRTNYKHLHPLNCVVSVTWAKTVGGGGFVAPAVYCVVSVNRAQDYDYERNTCNPFRNRFSSLLSHSVSSLPTKMKTTAPISSSAIIISSLRTPHFSQKARLSYKGTVNQMVIDS